MDKGRVGDVVDVFKNESANPGVVVGFGVERCCEVEVPAAYVRWSTGVETIVPWKDLFLLKAYKSEPVFEMSAWETSRVLERLRRVPSLGAHGPLMTRMTEFVHKHVAEVKARRLRERAAYFIRRAQELEAEAAAAEARVAP